MARHRVGVAVLLPEPVRTEVDALRRACGAPVERIPPHVTLVPPVNVRLEDLPRALDLARRCAAAEAGPLALELGPVRSFLPDNPVLLLEVGGRGLAALVRLRAKVFDGPFKRSARWPFVPHCTLVEELAPARIEAAVLALDAYRATIEVGAIHVLEQGPAPDRRWAPIESCPLGT